MCGITGFFAINPRYYSFETAVKQMTDRVAYRGPDDAGHWIDVEAGIALGHRRLSIVDLSPLGHQPMISASGRFVIVFNGEIYNFQSLRVILESKGYSFQGMSDTEVLLAAVEEWGIAKALEQFIGMFAFALWDKQEKTLYMALDRFGGKTLYY